MYHQPLSYFFNWLIYACRCWKLRMLLYRHSNGNTYIHTYIRSHNYERCMHIPVYPIYLHSKKVYSPAAKSTNLFKSRLWRTKRKKITKQTDRKSNKTWIESDSYRICATLKRRRILKKVLKYTQSIYWQYLWKQGNVSAI